MESPIELPNPERSVATEVDSKENDGKINGKIKNKITDMKTAMQELILNLTNHIKTQSYEWKRDPIAMLHQIDAMYFDAAIEKEKEQIVNAYTIGNRNGLDNKAFGANKYYRETYLTPLNL